MWERVLVHWYLYTCMLPCEGAAGRHAAPKRPPPVLEAQRLSDSSLPHDYDSAIATGRGAPDPASDVSLECVIDSHSFGP